MNLAVAAVDDATFVATFDWRVVVAAKVVAKKLAFLADFSN
jgi:hypothetical protein